MKMKSYLNAYGLWDIVENGPKEPLTFPNDATSQQMKDHDNILAKGFKALTIIHSALSEVMFIRIMSCETAKGT